MANILHTMGNLVDKFLVKRAHLPYSPNPYSLKNHLTFLQDGSEGMTQLDMCTEGGIKEALRLCPPVSYIINKKARAFCSGVISAVDAKTGKAVTGFKKAFQDIIDRPNFLQTGYQFSMQNYAQMQGWGYSVCLKVYAGGQISSIWALPNEHVHIEFEFEWHPFKRKNVLSGIKSVSYCGVELDKKDIYIFTDSTPYEDNMVLPISRLRSLEHPINNLLINFESRGKLMNKPMGIFSNNAKDNISAMEMDPADIEKLHRDFDKYGLSRQQKRFIITGATLDWKAISFPLSDMQMDIFERNDTITIAEGLDYPPFLLGISEKGIYNNVSEAYKGLYTGSVMPDGDNYVQQLDQCFEAQANGIKYKIDFSHLSVLQEGLKYKSETREILGRALMSEFHNNLITYGRMMELLDEVEYNQAWKDKYFYQIPELQKAVPEKTTTPNENPKPDETKK